MLLSFEIYIFTGNARKSFSKPIFWIVSQIRHSLWTALQSDLPYRLLLIFTITYILLVYVRIRRVTVKHAISITLVLSEKHNSAFIEKMSQFILWLIHIIQFLFCVKSEYLITSALFLKARHPDMKLKIVLSV